MMVSEAKKRANKKYYDKAWTQVKLSMPKEEAEALTVYCEEKGYTKAGFIRQAIKDRIESGLDMIENGEVSMPEKKFNATQYKNQFQKEKYDRLSLCLPKGMKDKISSYAKSHDYNSVNSFVIDAINEKMNK